MFEINLAKKRKLKTDRAGPRFSIPAPRKSIIYLTACIFIAGAGLYFYLPELQQMLIKPPEETPPLTVLEEPAPEPAAEPEPPVEQPPPPPETVTEETVTTVMAQHAGFASNKRQIDTYNTIAASLSRGSDYNLISVQGRVFVTEIISGTASTSNRSEQRLRSKLADSHISKYAIGSRPGSPLLNTGLWGFYPDDVVSDEHNTIKTYLTNTEFLQRVRAIGKQHDFLLRSPRNLAGDFRGRIPLHYHGPKGKIRDFLTAFEAEQLNCSIAKISGMPYVKMAVGDAQILLMIDVEVIHN